MSQENNEKEKIQQNRIEITNDNRELSYVFDKNSGCCWHCGKKLAWKNYGLLGKRGAWEVDYSRPLARGGTSYLRNLVPSCVECNRSKGDLGTHEFGNY